MAGNGNGNNGNGNGNGGNHNGNGGGNGPVRASASGGGIYIYPQPGPCGGMKVAAFFAGAGQAILRFRSARGTLIKTQVLSAAMSGVMRADLDCAGLEAGLYWLEVEADAGSGIGSRPPVRFILRER